MSKGKLKEKIIVLAKKNAYMQFKSQKFSTVKFKILSNSTTTANNKMLKS